MTVWLLTNTFTSHYFLFSVTFREWFRMRIGMLERELTITKILYLQHCSNISNVPLSFLVVRKPIHTCIKGMHSFQPIFSFIIIMLICLRCNILYVYNHQYPIICIHTYIFTSFVSGTSSLLHDSLLGYLEVDGGCYRFSMMILEIMILLYYM